MSGELIKNKLAKGTLASAKTLRLLSMMWLHATLANGKLKRDAGAYAVRPAIGKLFLRM